MEPRHAEMETIALSFMEWEGIVQDAVEHRQRVKLFMLLTTTLTGVHQEPRGLPGGPRTKQLHMVNLLREEQREFR